MIEDDRILDMLIRREEARDEGRDVSLVELCKNCPELLPELERHVKRMQAIESYVDTEQADCETFSTSGGLRDVMPVDALAGSEVLDRYRIVKPLGYGGYGSVWNAYDLELHRHIAIKFPRDNIALQEATRHQFLSEARKLAELDHPNIVPVYDVGEWHGAPFIVTKLIQGPTLAEYALANELAVEMCVEIVAAVATALHYAHKRGIIHRDVKPRNIFIDVNGRPHLGDFGIAISSDTTGRASAKAAFTRAYAAPEQLHFDPERCRSATDVFGLGVVLYELLTGRLPFGKQGVIFVASEIGRLPQRPGVINPNVPAALDRICLRALANDPEDRFSSMKEFAQALSAASFEPPPSFKLVGHLQRPRSVAIAAENPMAVSTSKDKTVRVWDLVGQRKQGQLLHNAEFIYDVAVTASGSLIAGAGSDGILYLWQWPQTKPAAQLQGHTGGVFCVRLSPDGKQLITGGRDAAVRVWDIESRKILRTIADLPERVQDVAVSPDGQFVAVACPGSASEATPPLCKSVWLVPLTGHDERREFRGHEEGVRAVAFSPDGKYLASGTRSIWKSGIYQPSEDRNILIWDVDTGEIVQRLVTDGDGFTSLLFTLGGRRLISRRVLHRHDDRDPEDDPMMAIWDLHSGQLLTQFPGGEAVACSPNGDYMLYSAMDASLRAVKFSELLGSGSSP